jgi:uncharacterized protein YdeI (YjbR/CyaY-like superfamily)
MTADIPVLPFGSAEAFRTWLDEHHADSDGLWIKIAKKGAGINTVTHSEALDVALCYGWIDGQRDKFDEMWFLQKFTPRRPRSRWSKINTEKVERLIEAGLMQPAGMAQVDAAKADGRWEAAYVGQRVATVPDDLQAALDADPPAKAFFETLRGSNRYAILYRVEEAKRPETRAKRIAQFVAMCREGRTLH